MTENGTFIINGTERVIVVAAAPLAGRLLPHREDKTLYIGADHPVPRLLGGVRVRREEPALRPHRPQAEVPRVGVPARPRPARRRRDHPPASTPSTGCSCGGNAVVLGGRATAWSACARAARRRSRASSPSRAARRSRARRSTRCARPASRRIEIADDRARGRVRRRRRRRPGDRRGDPRGQRGADAARHLDGAGEERRARRRVLPRARRGRPGHPPDAEEGPDPDARRGAHRDLPPPAAGRSADARQLAVALREHVLQPAEVRLLAGRPPQAEHEARARTRRSTRRSCTRRTSTRSSSTC